MTKINHVEEYLQKQNDNFKVKLSRELFTGDRDDIDLKTDLGLIEIQLASALIYNDKFLESKGYKPVFEKYYNTYFRLKVSLERKSRGEYVKVNSGDDVNDFLNKASNLSNITGAKK